MRTNSRDYFCFTFITILCLGTVDCSGNVTCYQCVRKTFSECDPLELLPCAPKYDRCAKTISKQGNEITIQRECGLGPCEFEDDFVSRSLGMDKCDTSGESYFCLTCCKGYGCNGGTNLEPWRSYLMLSGLMLNFVLGKHSV